MPLTEQTTEKDLQTIIANIISSEFSASPQCEFYYITRCELLQLIDKDWAHLKFSYHHVGYVLKYKMGITEKKKRLAYTNQTRLCYEFKREDFQHTAETESITQKHHLTENQVELAKIFGDASADFVNNLDPAKLAGKSISEMFAMCFISGAMWATFKAKKEK